jgi:hypothetical protein
LFEAEWLSFLGRRQVEYCAPSIISNSFRSGMVIEISDVHPISKIGTRLRVDFVGVLAFSPLRRAVPFCRLGCHVNDKLVEIRTRERTSEVDVQSNINPEDSALFLARDRGDEISQLGFVHMINIASAIYCLLVSYLYYSKLQRLCHSVI